MFYRLTIMTQQSMCVATYEAKVPQITQQTSEGLFCKFLVCDGIHILCAIYHGQTSSQNIHSFSKNVKNRSSYGRELEHFSNDRSVFEFPPCFGFGSKYLRPSFFPNSCFKWFLALPSAICLEFLLFFRFQQTAKENSTQQTYVLTIQTLSIIILVTNFYFPHI